MDNDALRARNSGARSLARARVTHLRQFSLSLSLSLCSSFSLSSRVTLYASHTGRSLTVLPLKTNRAQRLLTAGAWPLAHGRWRVATGLATGTHMGRPPAGALPLWPRVAAGARPPARCCRRMNTAYGVWPLALGVVTAAHPASCWATCGRLAHSVRTLVP